ncbi:hypothetical protein PIB30_034698 [Stylosanthes scabra]|uniref:Uncharacterized protein n=1 Tax=Stylosanthes scabra TaxID=79078 RepID=A0ABU6TD59_9FABA|nr:hypothetical protein [Stylosanthes scabra]
MARKSKAVKEQKDDIDVKYDVYINLSNKKNELVHEMGFSDLVENVSNFNFNNLIMLELVEYFLIPTSSIKTNVAKISINAAKIGYVFGLPATGDIYPLKLVKKQVLREQYDAADHFRKKSLAELRDMVKDTPLDSEENITFYKRAFILYI